MDLSDPYNIIGIIGVILIIVGILRISSGKWDRHSILYEFDTIIGASMLLVYQIHHKAYIVMPINILYVYISFRGISSFAERYALAKQRKLKRLQKRKKS